MGRLSVIGKRLFLGVQFVADAVDVLQGLVRRVQRRGRDNAGPTRMLQRKPCDGVEAITARAPQMSLEKEPLASRLHPSSLANITLNSSMASCCCLRCLSMASAASLGSIVIVRIPPVPAIGADRESGTTPPPSPSFPRFPAHASIEPGPWVERQ